jgi:hypothetical protein
MLGNVESLNAGVDRASKRSFTGPCRWWKDGVARVGRRTIAGMTTSVTGVVGIGEATALAFNDGRAVGIWRGRLADVLARCATRSAHGCG